MTDWLTNNRKGLAILRVSSHRQRENISHDTQESEIREYCIRHGIELVEVRRIVESARHGSDRKDYEAAMGFALVQGIYHILFYMNDREARNLTDTELNETRAKRGEICLHYVRENKVINKSSADSDFFLRDMHAVTNKHYSRAHTTKVTDAMRRKAESGWYPSNNPPLGYKPAKIDGRMVVIPDPDERMQNWVRKEFELRALGLTYDEIRARVLAAGLVPKERRPTYRLKTIHDRIHNGFYWGRFNWQGIEYQGKHELIIPKSVLERVSRVVRGYKPRPFDPGQVHGLLAHGGFIKCACGCSVIYDPKEKTLARTGRTANYHYYRCTNGKRVHSRYMYIREDALWNMLDHSVDALTISEELAAKVSKWINDRHGGARAKAAREIQKAKVKLKELRDREDAATSLLLDGTLDKAGYGRVREQVRGEIAEWQSTLEASQFQVTGQYHETAQSIVELCKNAKRLYLSRSLPERRAFLEKLVLNCVLDNQTLRIVYRKPFEVIVNMNKVEEWWTRAELNRRPKAIRLQDLHA